MKTIPAPEAPMVPSNRRTILGRITAFLAVPFLLGRGRVAEFLPAPADPPSGPPPGGVRRSRRIAVLPPSQSVKRRG
jgi:hypothetical protein